MTIYYDDSRCGSGKTHAILKAMVNKMGKYLVAVDKIDIVSARRKEINELRPQDADIYVSERDSETCEGSVIREVEQLHTEDHDHQIIFITHKALKEARFTSRFNDWHLIIDEDFSTFVSDEMKIKVSVDMMKSMFDIVPFKGDFYEVKSDASIQSIKADAVLSDKVKYLRSLMDYQKVVTKSDEFEVGTFEWWSVWDYARVSAFKSVTILANAFTEKLSYKLASHAGVKFERIVRPDEFARVWSSRPVTIRYFSEISGSGCFFKSEDGAEQLKEISRWQAENYRGSEYWSKNEHMTELSLKGTYIKPKAAGRNDLMKCNVATFIYSAQASNLEGKALKTITDGKFDLNDILRDRELEDLCQFVLRGSLRDPFGTDPYEIRVYSKKQANFLKKFLIDNRYVDKSDVTVERIADVNLVRSPKPVADKESLKKRGRKPSGLYTVEQAEELRKAKDNLRRITERMTDKNREKSLVKIAELELRISELHQVGAEQLEASA